MNKKAEKGTVKRVLSCIRPYTFYVIVSIMLSALSVAMTLYVPVLVGKAIDLMLGKENVDFDKLATILVQIILLVSFTAIAQWIISTINNKITYNVVRDVREKAFSHIQTLPLKYLDTHSAGNIVSVVISDADQFADGLMLRATSRRRSPSTW